MSHNLTDRELNDLIAAAVAVTERMSPEERAAMMEAQRQSWARGEAGLRETSASPPRVPDESEPGQPMIDFETLPYSRDPGAGAWAKNARDELRRLAAENAELRAKVAELEKAIASIGPAAAIMWFNEGVEAAVHAVHDYMLASYDADGNSDLRVAIEVIRALKRKNGDG